MFVERDQTKLHGTSGAETGMPLLPEREAFTMLDATNISLLARQNVDAGTLYVDFLDCCVSATTLYVDVATFCSGAA